MRIRRDAQERYHFDESLFSPSGHLVLGSIRSAHVVANTLNSDRPDDRKVSPALLNAACVVHDIMHHVIHQFVDDQDPLLLPRVLGDAERTLGHGDVDVSLETFLDRFPDPEIVKESVPPAEYLERETDGTPNRQIALEEMLICWLTNENPGYASFKELIRDDDIRASSRYEAVIERFREMDEHKPGGQSARTLIELLLEPVRRSPNSLRDQLAFMADGDWVESLPEELTNRAVIGDDLIEEESRAMAARTFAPGPPPSPPVPRFVDEPEYEKFSRDVDWMPRVVMIAKNAFVWLDQLSKKYDRTITRLDQVPEEEIEQLARWGFTALWLIGIWERSDASRKLKHRMGNADAAASAYSIYDYVVSSELGGTSAVTGLRMTCQIHGIRLCSDMVPNHTGLDSRWVTEHPDWFVQAPQPPYPSYSYSSESLSDDPGLVIQVEDGYYDQSDAAVTFRRFDTHANDERFIYHGNDGTSMPWNDTAQLDFSKAEVREAVIQTILHVARQFPVIRFDAAMVLTRKHFRRLWYPAPGSGGGVPSRAEHAMTRQDFDRRMPVEFWREVVDRVAEEVPDTLLLAEAFWLLEGYFVRTLGMHRVYNSAFMHMLKDEDNAKYRDVMKNTLAFEPEILKRYVNFMSNPDEETALDQFGDGDKFFGVMTLLVTLPGLPMFGHGQVEGFAEKYGMEYRRAYRAESVNQGQVQHFEHTITPLMKKRYLFAEVKNFHLLDFEQSGRVVDENVFAYTNRRQHERALIVYNNRFEETAGRIRVETRLEGRSGVLSLGEALALEEDDGDVVTFTDLITSLEHVVPASEFFAEGLRLRLAGYQHHAFIGFEVVEDDEDGTLMALARQLDGRGVTNISEARSDLRLKPVEQLLTLVLEASRTDAAPLEIDADLLAETASRLDLSTETTKAALEDLVNAIKELDALPRVGERYKWSRSKRYKEATSALQDSAVEGSIVYAILVASLCLDTLRSLGAESGHRLLGPALEQTGLTSSSTGSTETVVELSRALTDALETDHESLLDALLDDTMFGSALGLNEFGGTTYYSKERFEIGLEAAFCLEVLRLVEKSNRKSADDPEKREGSGGKKTAKAIADQFDVVQTLRTAHASSNYDWHELGGSTSGKGKTS